jgi:hypothetical protein
MAEDAIRAAFALQGNWCRLLSAPRMGVICEVLARVLDRDTATGRAVLDWAGEPMADALMMRVTGGLNALVRRGDLPALAACYPPNPAPDDATLAAALADALRDDRLVGWLASAPQTNEVARSAVLMPGMKVIAAQTGLPLAIRELGASAGLNLRLDAYAYDLGGQVSGPAGAPLVLAPRWDGPPPPAVDIHVASRRGVDLNPLDLRDPATRERLLAFVWPEQSERVVRLQAAMAAFVADPVALDQGDAADWAEAHVVPAAGVTTVVFHSIAHQYFPAATQARIAAHMDRIGAAATADAPLAWLRYELEDASAGALPTLRLRLWGGDRSAGDYSGADRLLARAHPHGAAVQWLDGV